MQPAAGRHVAALIGPGLADSEDPPLQDADLLPCYPGLHVDS